MKIKTIVILIVMSSMLMTSSAETGTFEIKDAINNSVINATVNYDATVDDYLYVTKYNGDYDIEGIVNIEGKLYNADFNASGLFYTFKDGKIARLNLRLAGKIYQNSEVGFLYEENNEDYYGYIENGYNTSGDIYFCADDGPNQGGDILLLFGFVLDGYSKYVITNIIPQEENNEPVSSSPALGIGHGKSGDMIPTLYTYKDPDTGKRIVSETYPENYDGPVLYKPGRIVDAPILPNDFWTTPRGIKILENKANGK